MYFDMKTKQFKEKNHSPNKIWGVFFDNKGRDYVMDKDVSYKEMEKMITKDSQEIYDFEDSDLYEKMKETGVDKFYTKKWFTPFRIEDAQYATPSPLITAHKVGVLNEKRCKTKIDFVKGQLDTIK